jgi:hypothetical protein
LCLMALVREYGENGVSRQSVSYRLAKGWSIRDALTVHPSQGCRRVWVDKK